MQYKAIGINWIANEGEGEVDTSARLRLRSWFVSKAPVAVT